MTRTTKTTRPEVTPPRDYGAGDSWADDGDFYVPDDLRPFYADAEPSDQARHSYVTNGSSIVEDVERQVPRGVAPGTDTREPVVTYETVVVPTFRDLSGPSGYRQWLHIHRLGIAQQAKRHDDFLNLMESQWLRCRVCQVRDGSVEAQRVFANGTELYVIGCPAHLPVLVETARQTLADRAADTTLADGRRVGDVAAQVVADLIGGKDGAA